MRQILFRAKRIDNGEWVEGSFIDSGNHEQVFIYPHYDGASTMPCRNLVYHRMIAVDVETLSQYTGLTDKNGNKIWENDVVKKHFYTDYDAYANSEEYVGIVKFTDCAWVIDTKKNERVCTRPIFESMAYSKDLDYFEVIGNIFDNEDLLKGE